MSANDANNLFSKDASDRTEDEQQVVTILENLNVEENERESFLKNLEKGSLAVLASTAEDKPMVLINASRNEGALLMDAAVDKADTEVITASKQLLDSREIVDTPLGEIEFSIDTQGRDFSVVQIEMEDGGVNMDTLFKTDINGKPLVFQSEILSYSAEDGPLDDWLESLNYSLYNYSLNPKQEQAPITSVGTKESSIAASLLAADPVFDFNQLNNIDGSAFLIDLDQDKTIDLISMLLVDQGWFDTRPDVVGLIGDPLIPVATTETTPTGGGAAGGGGTAGGSGGGADTSSGTSASTSPPAVPTTGSGSSDKPETASPESTSPQPGNTTPDENASTTRTNAERSIDVKNPGATNPTDSIALTAPRNPVNATSTSNTINTTTLKPTDALPDGSEAGGNSVRGESNTGSLTKSANNNNEEVQNSITASEQQGEQQRSQGYLNDLQDWMANRRREVSDALRSTLSPLVQPQETSIAAAIGMLLLPLLTERSTTQLVKAIDRDVDLKLLRRNPNFNGRWLSLSQKGKPTVIRRHQGVLTLEPFTSIMSSDLTCLPGFDASGQAWLSKSISLCTKPGAFIKDLETTRTALLQSQAPEINWTAWIDRHFDTGRGKARQHNDAVQMLNALKNLISKATSNDPALADVVMLSQILDCAASLGLEKQRTMDVNVDHMTQPKESDQQSRSVQSEALAFKQRASEAQQREAS